MVLHNIMHGLLCDINVGRLIDAREDVGVYALNLDHAETMGRRI
jgi:hypothetical protein